MPGGDRRHSTAAVGSSQGFSHPYLPPASPRLSTKSATTRPKKELGLMDLFLFKMFGCFQTDDLPPPDHTATIYQAGRESSTSTLTTTTVTATTTSASMSTPEAPRKHKKHAKASKTAKLAAAKSWAEVPRPKAAHTLGKEVARMPGEKLSAIQQQENQQEQEQIQQEEQNDNQHENIEKVQIEQNEQNEINLIKDDNQLKDDQKDIKQTKVMFNDDVKENIIQKQSTQLELENDSPAQSLQGRVSRMSAMFEQE